MSKTFFIPLIAFIALVLLMLFGLRNDPKVIPSPFIGQPAPDFSLPKLYKPEEMITAKEMKGQVWVLNLWASWCVSCRAEHKVLSRLINKMNVPTIGLNYKETFVVDKKGIVRYKFTGPVHDDAVDDILVPLITELRKEEG